MLKPFTRRFDATYQVTVLLAFATTFLANPIVGLGQATGRRPHTDSSFANGQRVNSRDPAFSFIVPNGFYAKAETVDDQASAFEKTFRGQVIYGYTDREPSPADPAILIKIVRLKRHLNVGEDWMGDRSQMPLDVVTGTVDWGAHRLEFMQMPIGGGINGSMYVTQLPLKGEAVAVVVAGPQAKDFEMSGLFGRFVDNITEDASAATSSSSSPAAGKIPSYVWIGLSIGGLLVVAAIVGVVLAFTVFNKPKKSKRYRR